MRQKITYLFFLIVISNFCTAQINEQQFIKEFNNSNYKNKVRLVANANFNDINTIYPKIKDSLQIIKKIIYNNTESKEAKFLFDKIEADIEMYNNHYAKAIFILENSLNSHAQNVNDSLKCLVLLKISLIKIQDYIKAFEANRLIEKIIPRKLPDLKLNLGEPKSTLYNLLGLTNEAIQCRRNEFNQQTNTNDSTLIINYYNDLGVFYNRLKNVDSAQFYFLKAKALLNVIKIPANKIIYFTFFKGLVDGNLGNSYFISGETRAAIPYIKNDIYSSLLSDNFESAANAYQLLSQCYIKLNEPKIAKQYIDSLSGLLHKKGVGSKSTLAYVLLKANYFNLINDYKKASENYLLFINIRDSISVTEKERQLVNEEVAFNVEEKEIEILEKNKILAQNRLNEAKQKTFNAYLLTGILLLVTVIIFLIFNNKSAKKREAELAIINTKINNQNSVIEQSLKEKELLIKEIHHRVKNNLQIITSMLSLQIAKITDDEKTQAILREAQQRISSIALTHQMLYQKESLSNIVLGEYIEKLVRQIETTMPNNSIKLITNIELSQKRVSIDNAVPLGLLINEILTNAYKHAFAGRENGIITVSLMEQNLNSKLTIHDNGIGLPIEYSKQQITSMGMELIHILAHQIDGNLIIESNSGTAFILEIKK